MMYDKVTAVEGGQFIICRMEDRMRYQVTVIRLICDTFQCENFNKSYYYKGNKEARKAGWSIDENFTLCPKCNGKEEWDSESDLDPQLIIDVN